MGCGCGESPTYTIVKENKVIDTRNDLYGILQYDSSLVYIRIEHVGNEVRANFVYEDGAKGIAPFVGLLEAHGWITSRFGAPVRVERCVNGDTLYRYRGC